MLPSGGEQASPSMQTMQDGFRMANGPNTVPGNLGYPAQATYQSQGSPMYAMPMDPQQQQQQQPFDWYMGPTASPQQQPHHQQQQQESQLRHPHQQQQQLRHHQPHPLTPQRHQQRQQQPQQMGHPQFASYQDQQQHAQQIQIEHQTGHALGQYQPGLQQQQQPQQNRSNEAREARQMMQYQQSPSTVPMNMAGKNERDKMAVNTVWVGRLTKTTTETSLRHFFRDFAPYITSVHLKPGERKGDQYAFVNFASLSEARRAMKNLQGKQVDDCRSVMLRIDENLDNDHFRRLHQANVGLPRALRVFAQSIGFNFSRYARMDMRHIAVPKGLQGTGGATIPRVGVPACLWIGNLKPNTSEGDVRRLLSTWLLHISGIRLTLQRASLLCFSFVDFDTKVSAFDCYMYFAVSNKKLDDLDTQWQMYHNEHMPAAPMRPDGGDPVTGQSMMPGDGLAGAGGQSSSYSTALVNRITRNLSSLGTSTVNGTGEDGGLASAGATSTAEVAAQQGGDPECLSITGLPMDATRTEVYEALGEHATRVADISIRRSFHEVFLTGFVEFRQPGDARTALYQCHDRQVAGCAAVWRLVTREQKNEAVENGVWDERSNPAVASRVSRRSGFGRAPAEDRNMYVSSEQWTLESMVAEQEIQKIEMSQRSPQQQPAMQQQQPGLPQMPMHQMLAQQLSQPMMEPAQHPSHQAQRQVFVQGNQFAPPNMAASQMTHAAQPERRMDTWTNDPTWFPVAQTYDPLAEANAYAPTNLATQQMAPMPQQSFTGGTPFMQPLALAATAAAAAYSPVTPLPRDSAAAVSGMAPGVAPQPPAPTLLASQLPMQRAQYINRHPNHIQPNPNAGVIGQQPPRIQVPAVGPGTEVADIQASQPPVAHSQGNASRAAALQEADMRTHANAVQDFMEKNLTTKDQDGKYNAVLSTETEIFDFSQQSLQQTPSEAQHITLTYDDGNVTVTGEDQRRVAEMAVSIQYEMIKLDFHLDSLEFEPWTQSVVGSKSPIECLLLERVGATSKVMSQVVEDTKTLVLVGFSDYVIKASSYLGILRSCTASIQRNIMEVLCHIKPQLMTVLCDKFNVFAIGYQPNSTRVWFTGDNRMHLSNIRQSLTILAGQACQKTLSLTKVMVPSARQCLIEHRLDKEVCIVIADDDAAPEAVKFTICGLDAGIVDRVVEVVSIQAIQRQVPCETESGLVVISEVEQIYNVHVLYNQAEKAYQISGLLEEDVNRAANGVETLRKDKKVELIESSDEQREWFHKSSSTEQGNARQMATQLGSLADLSVTASFRYIEVHGKPDDIEKCKAHLCPMLKRVTSHEVSLNMSEGFVAHLETMLLKQFPLSDLVLSITIPVKVLDGMNLRVVDDSLGKKVGVRIEVTGLEESVFDACQFLRTLNEVYHDIPITNGNMPSFMEGSAIRTDIQDKCCVLVDLLDRRLHLSALTQEALNEAIKSIQGVIVDQLKTAISLHPMTAQLVVANAPDIFKEVEMKMCSVDLGATSDWSGSIAVELSGPSDVVRKIASAISEIAVCSETALLIVPGSMHQFIIQFISERKEVVEQQGKAAITFGDYDKNVVQLSGVPKQVDLRQYSPVRAITGNDNTNYEVYVQVLSVSVERSKLSLNYILNDLDALEVFPLQMHAEWCATLRQALENNYANTISVIGGAVYADEAHGAVCVVDVGPLNRQQVEHNVLTIARPQQQQQQGASTAGAAVGRQAPLPAQASALTQPSEKFIESFSRAPPQAVNPSSNGPESLASGMATMVIADKLEPDVNIDINDKLIANALYHRHWSWLMTTAQSLEVKCDPVLASAELKYVRVYGGREASVHRMQQIVHERITQLKLDIVVREFQVDATKLVGMNDTKFAERLHIAEQEYEMECHYPRAPSEEISRITEVVKNTKLDSLGQRQLLGLKAVLSNSSITPYVMSMRCFRHNSERCMDAILKHLDTCIEERQVVLRLNTRHYLNQLAASLFLDLSESPPSQGAVKVTIRGHKDNLKSFDTVLQEERDWKVLG